MAGTACRDDKPRTKMNVRMMVIIIAMYRMPTPASQAAYTYIRFLYLVSSPSLESLTSRQF